jgi:putative CocE/NonD family hydrolase
MNEEINILWDKKIPIRDGINLSADIYGLSDESKRPSILLRTPYGKTTDPIVSTGKFFAARGYIFISCDVRGRGDSDGTFEPYRFEGKDGFDVIQWISKQPWSNGSVATWGASYSGRIQWYTAVLQPPALKAMISVVPPSDPFVEDPTGVASPLNVSWEFLVSGRSLQNTKPVDWQKVYRHLPMREMDQLTGRKIPHWHTRLDHQKIDSYTKEISYQDKFERVMVPVLHVSGWYDDEQIGTPLNFSAMSKHSEKKVAENQYMIMGPWGHAVNTSRVIGEFDFGPTALIDLLDIEARWLDRYLKVSKRDFPFDKKAKIFIMGSNEWAEVNAWPPENTTEYKLYLSSGGKANSRFGDGKLQPVKPDYEERVDSYTYDPENPVPFIADQNYAQIGGPDDYSSVERRDDVLVYTTDALDDPITIIGPVKLSLNVSTSATDTDFTAKLLAVLPDLRSIRLCDGIVRMRYRGGMNSAVKTVPGKIYQVSVDMWNTSYRFTKGERIRLEVSSSAFPKFARNLNFDGDQTGSKKMIKADQSILHGSSKQSFLSLYAVKKR